MEVNPFKLAFTIALAICMPFIIVLEFMFVHDVNKDTNHERTYEKYNSMKVMEGKIVDAHKPLIGKAEITVKDDETKENRRFKINKTDYANNVKGNHAKFRYTTDKNNVFEYDEKQYGKPKSEKEFKENYHN